MKPLLISQRRHRIVNWQPQSYVDASARGTSPRKNWPKMLVFRVRGSGRGGLGHAELTFGGGLAYRKVDPG